MPSLYLARYKKANCSGIGIGHWAMHGCLSLRARLALRCVVFDDELHT